MERILYLDCAFGITEHSLMGALLHLGADLTYINRFIGKLPFGSFTFERKSVEIDGILASKSVLHSGPIKVEDELTKALDIYRFINSIEIPDRAKERSRLVIHALTAAYSSVKGIPVENASFKKADWTTWAVHIIGICLGLESLEIKQIHASPILIGKGIKKTDDGMSYIPHPSVYELLKGMPITEVRTGQDSTTPLGASLFKSLVQEVTDLNQMRIERIGYGSAEAGGNTPNILRASIVKPAFNDSMKRSQSEETEESIVILEFQVDDMPGEGLGFLMGELLEAGALDVFYTPVYMKKNRPGILVTALSSVKNVEKCEEVILTETTTLGVRKSLWSRRILERNIVCVDTCYGPIRLKQAIKNGKVLRQIPEYDDVKKAAKEYHTPFHEVYTMALAKVYADK